MTTTAIQLILKCHIALRSEIDKNTSEVSSKDRLNLHVPAQTVPFRQGYKGTTHTFLLEYEGTAYTGESRYTVETRIKESIFIRTLKL